MVPSRLASASQQSTSPHSFGNSALFVQQHLLATKCIIAMVYAPDTADWVLNFFNINIIMPKLKHEQQTSNTRWFKFPSSQAIKLLPTSYNLAANPIVLGDLHLHISILLKDLKKKKNTNQSFIIMPRFCLQLFELLLHCWLWSSLVLCLCFNTSTRTSFAAKTRSYLSPLA